LHNKPKAAVLAGAFMRTGPRGGGGGGGEEEEEEEEEGEEEVIVMGLVLNSTLLVTLSPIEVTCISFSTVSIGSYTWQLTSFQGLEESLEVFCDTAVSYFVAFYRVLKKSLYT
jgi:hypothetical protein